MPTFTPPTINVVRQAAGYHTHAQRRISQISQPMKQGQTLYKIGATWHLQLTPSQAVLDTADPVFLGGHWYTVDDDVLDEILAAGFTPSVLPEAFPSTTETFPSTSLFPSS